MDALVISAPACPVSQNASRSGIISRVARPPAETCRAAAASWKIVLIGSCWMPVIAYSSAAGTWPSTRSATPVGPRVPVVHRVPEQRAAGIEQPVVDAPGVDAEAGHAGGPGRGTDTVQDALVQREDVPVEGPEHSDRKVGESVHFVEFQLVTPVGDPHHHPAAGGAEVDGDHRRG